MSITEEQSERAHEIREQLYTEIHDLLDAKLKDEPQVVQDEVRDVMTSEFRFWKRIK